MPINYSKWDALELSDDSDIEVHPNVDKRSFIRAKQNQIHIEREKRRHEIKTLKYERTVNDGLLERIEALLSVFREHAAQAVGGNPDEFVMNAVMETTLPPNQDKPAEPPADVHYKTTQPKYSEMIASLLDQVKKEEVIEKDDWYAKYIAGIDAHKAKVADLQQELLAKLAELEKEEASKITSDSIHTGFSTSSIAKEAPKPAPAPQAGKKKNTKGSVETVEVLNPAAAKRNKLKRLDSEGQTSGADGDVDEPVNEGADNNDDEEEEEDYEVTALGQEFAKIKSGDYQACLKFIGSHPEVLAERETDGLLMEAFNAGLKGEYDYSKQCVHQGLLLQYCRTLGKDGVGLFFKRITTKGHNAQKVFLDDVSQTFSRIKSRTAEIAKERAANPSGAEGEAEQIQLHAVDPGTEIMIQIPAPNSTDETEIAARKAFESFPPGLQRAMESKSLDRINEVLGKMSVSEAEEVVEKMSTNSMLSMEQGVIDGTTEEGQQRLKELEEEGKSKGEEREVSLEEGLEKLAREQAGKKEDVEVADVD